ncbi:MAG: hypothetical protein V4634_12610 [Pseudomonadota bacterium]
MKTISHFIAGARVDAQNGRYAEVFNPALGQAIASAALGNADQVGAAAPRRSCSAGLTARVPGRNFPSRK